MGSIGELPLDEVVRLLALAPHPEGGFFRETFRDKRRDGSGRSVSTAIYYCLGAGMTSAWHRVDAAEIWHFYAGAPLELRISRSGDDQETLVLGRDVTSHQQPQIVVPAGAWQSACPLGAWTLVGCTVAPGFIFEQFELAPPWWQPGAS